MSVHAEKDTDLTKMGRYLCLILRHKPEVAGITLDEYGWADVSELIRGVNKTRSLTMDLLEEIVAKDEKQRYSFNDDKSQIRANQGHSIPVDVELDPAEPPDFLFHGTAEKYVHNIEQTGLLPKSRLFVHLSANRATAIDVGSRHGAPVVFRVAAKKMAQDGYMFYRSVNGVWMTKQVPIYYLEQEITGGAS